MRLTAIATICLIVILSLSVPLVQAQDSSSCVVCGKTIIEDPIEVEGNYYHAKCFTCDHCKKPIPDSFTRYEGGNYHTPCFEAHFAMRCEVCGEIIKGKYVSTFWGNRYHAEHQGVEIQCSFCGRLIVGDLVEKSVVFQDSRHLCGICTPTAVFETAEAKSLVKDIAKRLAGFGLKVDPRSIEVILVNKDDLRRLASGASQDTRGFVNYQLAKNVSGDVTHRAIRMYLLYGMPKTEMAGTIAHELTHVWLILQDGMDRDRALVEGSCNYATYLVLQDSETDRARFIIDNLQKNPDAAYGEGFRRIKRFVETNGLDGWRRLMKEPTQKASF